MDDIADLVSTDCLSPTKVCYCVVSACASSMAVSLEGVSTDGAARKRSVASSVIDRIGSMPEMIGTSVRTLLVITNVVSWRSGKAEATGSKCFRECLECDGWQTKGQTKERRYDTT